MPRRTSADDVLDICAALPEILAEAWAAKAPKTLAKEYFDHG